jgi:polysaccharide export outer membrane protein
VVRPAAFVCVMVGALIIAACSSGPPPPSAPTTVAQYRIGAGDVLEISVWQNKELSTSAPVRPDGLISVPLVNDIQAAGKTPTELSTDIEARLKKFVTDPVVTVIVSSFVGASAQQVRVVGEAAKPQAIPYRENMSVLDAMIATGGLTAYAAGNRATLIRTVNGKETSYRLRLGDLLKDGDMSANAPLEPGDVIIIPQTYF